MRLPPCGLDSEPLSLARGCQISNQVEVRIDPRPKGKVTEWPLSQMLVLSQTGNREAKGASPPLLHMCGWPIPNPGQNGWPETDRRTPRVRDPWPVRWVYPRRRRKPGAGRG